MLLSVLQLPTCSLFSGESPDEYHVNAGIAPATAAAAALLPIPVGSQQLATLALLLVTLRLPCFPPQLLIDLLILCLHCCYCMTPLLLSLPRLQSLIKPATAVAAPAAALLLLLP
jgi:hypothetical protein